MLGHTICIKTEIAREVKDFPYGKPKPESRAFPEILVWMGDEVVCGHIENLFRSLFDMSPNIMGICDLEGNIIQLNSALTEILGYTMEDLCNTNLMYSCFPDDLERSLAELHKLATIGEKIIHFENRMCGKDGIYKWLVWDAVPDLPNGLIYVIGSDITERKAMEMHLRTSHNILERISDAFYALDKNYRFTYFNSRAEQLSLIERESVLGMVIWDAFPQARNTRLEYELRRALNQKVTANFDGPSILLENRWYEWNIYPSNEGLTVFFRDITDRKRAEEELSRLSAIVELSNYAIATGTLDGTILSWNEGAEVLYGYSADEIVGKSVNRLIPAYSSYPSETILASVSQGKYIEHIEITDIKKNGDTIDVSLSVYPVKSTGGNVTGFCAIARDISERKRSEKELSLSEERFSKIFHASPIMMCIKQLSDYRIIDVNAYWLKYTGYTKEEVIGRTANELDIIGDEFVKCLSQNRSGRYTDRRVRYRTKPGEVRTCILSTRIIDVSGEKCMLCLMKDTTDLERIQNEMSRYERLNVAGQMAASISHEIRNPLTTVRGFLQLLMSECTDRKYTEYYGLMIDELDRANDIISEFLTLGRNQTTELSQLNLNSIVLSLLPLLQADALDSGKWVQAELFEIPDLYVDKKEIRQLILNLVRNGLEAMEPGKHLTISTYVEEQSVVLSVQDQGSGIVPEILEKIGTPFITTKENGTGLGLAICYSIIERHNASLRIDTSSTGTTFYVRFPCLES